MTENSTVLIIGAGHGGFQTAASLRQNGYAGRIRLIGEEPGLPYHRPPLTKAYLAGDMTADHLPFRKAAFFEKNAIEVEVGRATSVDPTAQLVRLASGAELAYDRLVLATGARARPLPTPGTDLDGVHYLRTRADADALAPQLETIKSAIVIGGGFIGLEFAAVARHKGVDVTVIEAFDRLMARAVSQEVSEFYAREHAAWGTRILCGETATQIHANDSGRATAVETSGGRRLEADLVLIAIGIVPNVELASASGLPVDDGIVVDASLRTADPGIFAIGDCARFPYPYTDAPTRLESVQNAVDHARCVAATLSGGPDVPYAAPPWFWSDQGDLKLKMVGLTAGYDESVIRGVPDDRSFSVFCFRAGRLLGVESVNDMHNHTAMRRLFSAARGSDIPLTPDQARDTSVDLRDHVESLQPAG